MSLFLIFLFGCKVESEINFEKSLSLGKTKEEINSFMKYLETQGFAGVLDDEFNINRNNLTYFIMFILKEDQNFGNHDFSFKATEKLLVEKLLNDGTVVRVNELKKLSISDNKGTFTVDNKILEGRFIFLSDKRKGGEIIKMVIAKKGSNKIDDGIIVFDIIK